jgi:sigma54-dependent transcription regulator
MSYREDDLGTFSATKASSTIQLSSCSQRTSTRRHYPLWPNTTTLKGYRVQISKVNLGIYDSIKLSPYIENRAGELLEFITLDQYSHNTFVTTEALNLLERYSTDELCFVMVVGNRGAGKSFFCDKILNLSEVRGNHVYSFL